MSTIRLNVTEHLLTIENLPIMAAGSEKNDTLQANFDPSWDGFAKIAVFYQKNGNLSYALMNEGKAEIPSEALNKKGDVDIGIMGISQNAQITTNTVRYNIKNGLYIEIKNPEQDIYRQILSQFTIFEKIIDKIRTEMQNKTEINDKKISNKETYSSDKIEKLLAAVNYKQAELKNTYNVNGGGKADVYQIANVVIIKITQLLFTGSVTNHTILTYDDCIEPPLYSTKENISGATAFVTEGSREIKITSSGGYVNGTILFLVSGQIQEGDTTLSDIIDSIAEINLDVELMKNNFDKSICKIDEKKVSKMALKYNYEDDLNALIQWERGTIDASGENIENDLRLRTKTYISNSVDRILTNSNTVFIVFIYDKNNNYVTHTADRTDFSNLNHDVYNYRIVLKNKDYTTSFPLIACKDIAFLYEKKKEILKYYDIASSDGNIKYDSLEGKIILPPNMYVFLTHDEVCAVGNASEIILDIGVNRKKTKYLYYSNTENNFKITDRNLYLDSNSTYCIMKININNTVITNCDVEIDGEFNRNNKSVKKKTINFLGDSITLGRISNKDGTSNGTMKHPFTHYVAARLDCNYNVYAVGGSTITGGTNGYKPMSARYNEMKNADVIFVLGGTNDYADGWRPCPMGTWDDETSATFCGAFKILVEGLITKYPSGKILFATPLKREGGTNENKFGYTLKDYVEKEIEFCNLRSIPILNLYNAGMLTPDIESDKNNKTYDGLHPNEFFHKDYLAIMISKFIEQYI